MAIRTRYPLSPLRQLRLRLELATRRTRRALEERRRVLRLEAAQKRLAVLDADRARYDAFFDAFDDLVGTVCGAAQCGLQPHHEDRYQKRRPHLVEEWPRVRRSLVLHGGQPDAFEALWTSPSLAYLLETDGGKVIHYLDHTQTALEAWNTHLCRETEALAGERAALDLAEHRPFSR